MPSEILLFLFATAAAAALLLIARSVRRGSRHQLEPENLQRMETSARRARSTRAHRRPPTGIKQSALLPGRHAGQ